MRQRIISFLFALLCLVSVSAAGAQDAPRLWWSADPSDVKSGQQTTLRIQVSAADQIYGVSFQLMVDPTAFEVVLNDQVPVTMGALFGGQPGFAVQNSVDAQTGRVDYALTLTQPAKPVSGDGELATVTLRALKDAPVQVTVMNASLVSPEFEDVNGTLVARSIQQIPVQVADASGALPASDAVAAVDAQSGANGSLPAAFNHIDLTQTAVETVPSAESPATVGSPILSPLTVATVVFFLGGALLLLVSLWMYSRIRHQMRASSEFEIGV